MTTIVTDRDVNASQLTFETACSLRVVGPYPDDYEDAELAGMTVVRTDDCDEDALAAAVAAHTADPDWVNPNYVPPPPPPTLEQQVQAAAAGLIATALEDANTFAEFKAAFAPVGQ